MNKDSLSDFENEIKQRGADFWDSHPCGGFWQDYAGYYAWYTDTEKEGFELIHNADWKKKIVLDVGCGRGAMSYFISFLGADAVFGIDMSLGSLSIAVTGSKALATSKNINFLNADAEKLPFPCEYFNAVVSIGVLHHTPDTQRGINEIYRVLKPGGFVEIMLYRSGNPKWWLTRFLRKISGIHNWRNQRQVRVWGRRLSSHKEDDIKGTALHELFGVPVMKAFSNQEALKLFSNYKNVHITNYQPGFRRLGDIMPVFRPLGNLLERIDQRTVDRWGFYQMVSANK